MKCHGSRHSAIQRGANGHPPAIFLAIAGEECGFGIFPGPLGGAQAMFGKMAQRSLEQSLAAQPAASNPHGVVIGGSERHPHGAQATEREKLCGTGCGKMYWHLVIGSGSCNVAEALDRKPLTLSLGLWLPNG